MFFDTFFYSLSPSGRIDGIRNDTRIILSPLLLVYMDKIFVLFPSPIVVMNKLANIHNGFAYSGIHSIK